MPLESAEMNILKIPKGHINQKMRFIGQTTRQAAHEQIFIVLFICYVREQTKKYSQNPKNT